MEEAYRIIVLFLTGLGALFLLVLAIYMYAQFRK